MNPRIIRAMQSFRKQLHSDMDKAVDMIAQSISMEFEEKNPKAQEKFLYTINGELQKIDLLKGLREKIVSNKPGGEK